MTMPLLLLSILGVAPSEAATGGACQMCFGALADSPTVVAVGASMFLLLVVTSCVLGGVTAFFRRAHERAILLEGIDGAAPDHERAPEA